MSESRERAERTLLGNLSLARGEIDRCEQLRIDGEALARVKSDPATRVLMVQGGTCPVDASGQRLSLVSPAEVADDVELLLLGADEGVTYLAARVGPEAPAPAGSTWRDLRGVGAILPDRDAGLMVTAVALDNWHAVHPHCPRCGAATSVAAGGWVRRCDADGTEHYPRTDPAVIVLVIDDDDRALLGRQAKWQPGWFSTLAGFVEPGESAEAAVRREVLEESGIAVHRMEYLGSQPWPFPCSLMLGYHAWTSLPDVDVDGEEIVEARWFSRAELAAACDEGSVLLPPAVSIARRLVERWFGEPLKGDWIRP